MPGYEPFLLCDFHIHTQWSDGKLTVAEVVDMYGQTGKFDVIAITDHILMKKDLLARAGRIATLGRRQFGVREHDFADYLADIEAEGRCALKQYGMLVIPGAEVTQNRIRAKKNSHTATSTSRSTSIRGRRSSAVRRTGRRSAARCAATSTSRSRCSEMGRGPQRNVCVNFATAGIDRGRDRI